MARAYKSVKITLVENSTAGNQAKTFAAQTVEISHEVATVVQGRDGPISIGYYPSKILWLDGTAKDLENITDVKIVGENRDVLVDDALCTTFEAPRDVTKGVEFFVLKREGQRP